MPRPAFLIAVGAAVLASTLATPALGEETPPTGEVDGRLVLVLDSSGSMAEPAAGGRTKIEAAKQALTQVVDNLPDDAEVGMRVFGATVFERGDKGACTDTQNVVPVGPLDREALESAIARYEPYGETPIGAALKGAAKDLGPEGKRTIVLLSDGEPTCAPDPCKVARQLHRQGVDLTINVVGLDVGGDARRALQCIAQAGGGTYYDVDDPEELAGSLVQVSVRSLREFSLRGTPVQGGRGPRTATAVTPGQYTDRIGPGETVRYYSVEKQPGWGLHVGVTLRPESDGGTLEGVELGLYAPGGRLCTDASQNRANVLGERAVVSAAVSIVPGVTPLLDDSCVSARRVVVEVSYDRGPTDKPFEMVVREQPPVRNVEELPPPVQSYEKYVVPAQVRGDPASVLGGASFNDAPRLEPGVYSDTIRPGEQLFYRVPVGWGQAARVTITAGPNPRAGEVLGVQGDTMGVVGFNPVRDSMSSLTYGDDNTTESVFYNGEDRAAATWVTAPVRLRNATEFDQFIDGSFLAGDYFVSVEMGTLDDDTRFVAPLTIEVELVGEVVGVPDFAEPAQPSPTASPSASPTATPSPATDGQAGEASDASPADSTPGWLLPALGVLLVAGAAVGGWVALRRRGSS